MSKKEIYKIGKILGLDKNDIDNVINAPHTTSNISPNVDLYKTGTDYGTISHKELYKAGSKYGTISPKELYKAGTRYGTVSPKDF